MASFTFSKTVTDWEMLMNAVAANAADLPQLEPVRAELEDVLQAVMELGAQQDVSHARAQETSRVLDETMRRGKGLAARLRSGVRAQYGYRSEKLTEFQLRPFRKRSPLGEPAPLPEAPAPDPTVAA